MPSKSTLENQMLYKNLVRLVQSVDPDFDLEQIDRHLEPEEAKAQLRDKYGIHLGRKKDVEPNHMKEYRGHLHDRGIRHPRLQNFVMRQEKPPKDEDIDYLSYMMSARPHKNIKQDIARKAKPAKTVAQYARHPNRFDITGVDTPGSTFDPDWF